MLTDGRDSSGWVLKALREAGNSLLAELHDLDDDTLCRRPAAGDWSLKEIAAHLRDAEELALRQFSAISEGARGALPFWDVDLLPMERDYRSADLSHLLGEFRALRRQTTGLLWGLMPSDWEAPGRHPYRGAVTLEEIARELAQHDLEHLWQVRRLKAELGASRSAIPRDDDW